MRVAQLLSNRNFADEPTVNVLVQFRPRAEDLDSDLFTRFNVTGLKNCTRPTGP